MRRPNLPAQKGRIIPHAVFWLPEIRLPRLFLQLITSCLAGETQKIAMTLDERQNRAKLAAMQTKVLSSELKIGMFVASLDRPWLDTPFMFQGFLIQDEEDLRLLRQYCEFVQIDWTRSPLPQPLSGLTKLDQTDAELAASQPSPVIYTPATGKKPPAGDDGKDREPDRAVNRNDSDHEGYLSGIAERMMDMFKSNSAAPRAGAAIKKHRPLMEERAQESNKRPAFIPPYIEISPYVDAAPVEEEIAPAVKARDHANDVLENLVNDIKSNKRFAFAEGEAVVQEVVGSMVRNPDAMMWITRLRKQDEIVYGHGLQVAVNMVALGRHLGLPKEFLDRLCTIGLLLDIGKIKLPKELLLKKGRLTPEEFDTVKSHVQLALDILKETPDLHPEVLQGIAQHHERENGSGYPAGLVQSEISLFGRMAAIVDSFSALTNPRPYADTMPAYEALQCLSNFNPDLYQASMLEQLIQAIGVFPVGSLVELSSGEVAVVISHSKVRRLKPRVLIISDANKQQSPQPTTLDLIYQPLITGKNEIYILRGLPSGAYGLDAREYFL